MNEVTAGIGLIVTINVKERLVPHGVLGVTRYAAVTAELVVLVSVPKIFATPVICETPPVKPLPEGADHLYVVPFGITPLTISVGVIPNGAPLQVVVVIVLILAPGLIVTTSVNGRPIQDPAVGVTI